MSGRRLEISEITIALLESLSNDILPQRLNMKKLSAKVMTQLHTVDPVTFS